MFFALLRAILFLPWCMAFPVAPTTDLKGWDLVKDYFHQFFMTKKDSPLVTQGEQIQFLQQFFHLNVTGLLDKQTLSVLHLPRCGVPDVAYNYVFPERPKWNEHTLTYRIINYPYDLKTSTVKYIMHAAFSIWSSVTPLVFKQVESKDADINISFWALAHEDGLPFDGPGGVLGHAFFPHSETPGVVHFDKDEHWSTSYRGINLFLVATHELGHALGLYHSRNPKSIMYPTYEYQDPRTFHLSVEDIRRIQHLYGLCLWEGKGSGQEIAFGA
ncbi:PREDICTED: matrix metalloproteinase-26 [Chrysochloris asiatica]|uniref:Matrix metalloproteinase-26 n=1 Tax=Chrysochloris asiatica TaxID=185453 RepID=A0A9B0WVL9_CHRAS|nr:PREDICTED: matrix metalloproteinase-26 [Chrysochloris asiatica]